MSAAAARQDSTVANNLELNKGDNFIFCVDVSGLMGQKDCPGGQSRIEFLKEQVITFATEASKWDTDGIDVLTFGHQVIAHKGVTADKAAELIRAFKASEGSTDTAGVIAKAWEMHKAGGYEQTVCFIATDGEPNDKQKVMETIRSIASSVKDPREFTLSFLTVGVISPELRAFLTDLDDNLKAAHDIVDVKELTEVDFMAAFAGALND